MSTLQELAASMEGMKNEYKAMIGQLKNDLEEKMELKEEFDRKFKRVELEAANERHKHSILAEAMAAAYNDKLF